MPLVELLETTDVAALVLGCLDTTSMVALGRASRGVRAAQRSAIRDSPPLLVAAASNALALTKGQLVGWFALCDAEADRLPRTRHKRRAGGHASRHCSSRTRSRSSRVAAAMLPPACRRRPSAGAASCQYL